MKPGRWFLISARPFARAVEVTEAAQSTGVEPLFIDGRKGLGASMDHAFSWHPELEFYGWLADDTFPETAGWDRALSEAAGEWNLAYADDGGYLSLGSGSRDGGELTSGLCWGGELVRAAGSWSLGFDSAWLDMAWLELCRPLGLLRYVPEVTVRHDQWRTGRREKDELDEAAERAIERDRAKFYAWQQYELPKIKRRVEERMATCVS